MPALLAASPDPPKVRVILAHLLANAITATATGWVQMTVKPPDGQHWSIVVQDTGCGMTSGATARFYGDACSAPASDHSPGADSGLRTVRELAEQMPVRECVDMISILTDDRPTDRHAGCVVGIVLRG